MDEPIEMLLRCHSRHDVDTASTHMLYRPMTCAKTAEPMIDLLNGADMVCKKGGMMIDLLNSV